MSTAREDRTGIQRDDLKQSEPVNHVFYTNAQEFISISRKRLCNMAHKETSDVWKDVLNAVLVYEPELAQVCVRECVYRNGICPEFNCCGFNKTQSFKKEQENYLKLFK